MAVTVKPTRSNLPAMANVEGSIRPSHASLYNVFEDGKKEPVLVWKTTVLGTISNHAESFYKGKNEDFDPSQSKNNIQSIETAMLDPDCNRFCISGSVKFLSRCMRLTNFQAAKNYDKEKKGLDQLVVETMALIREYGGFVTLARAYASQLVNGSIAWRNKYAYDLQVHVQWEGERHIFDCYAETFGNQEAFDNLAGKIEKALTFSGSDALFIPSYEVVGRINTGGEVYPSQEMATGKKMLFKHPVKGIANAAGMHAQKIGNALRTIDTWYPEYSSRRYAIPVDPYGPHKAEGRALRVPGSGSSFYEIFAGLEQLLKRMEETKIPDEDALYFAAMMVRGGVFSAAAGK